MGAIESSFEGRAATDSFQPPFSLLIDGSIILANLKVS